MPFIVASRGPPGYLSRGRLVARPENATAYNSPSAAGRAIKRAIAAGLDATLTIIRQEHPHAHARHHHPGRP